MPNSIVNRRITVQTGFVYDSLAQDYFNRAGITNSIEKNAVNTLVLGMKANGLIDKCYAMYLCSPTSYGASLHNLISSSFLLSATAAPGFSTNGWQGDGVTQFLKTGFIPSTNSTLNDFMFGFVSKTVGQLADVEMGAVDGTKEAWASARWTDDTARISYVTSASRLDAANTDGTGNFFFGALSTTSRYVRRNKTSLGTSAAAHGTDLPTIEMYLLARNSAGAVNLASARLICGAYIFKGLTTAECDIVSDGLDAYNLNVISGGR